jgi:hypothetical protein
MNYKYSSTYVPTSDTMPSQSTAKLYALKLLKKFSVEFSAWYNELVNNKVIWNIIHHTSIVLI